MDHIQLVLEKLSLRDIHATVNEYDISWLDNAGTEYYIQLANIDSTTDRLAWLQSNEKDEYLLRVFENDTAFNWTPLTYNAYFGCFCNLLEWYNDHLIFCYTEKHDTYICSIREQQVNTFNFNGNKLERNAGTIFFQEYGDESKIVRRMLIPGLEEIEPITEAVAKDGDALPQLVLFSNQLKNKLRK